MLHSARGTREALETRISPFARYLRILHL